MCRYLDYVELFYKNSKEPKAEISNAAAHQKIKIIFKKTSASTLLKIKNYFLRDFLFLIVTKFSLCASYNWSN